ncbi:isopenicillin N synthase family dioxygenase [Subtercola endophyticus]|uniref:isopenicillin N synthase family dioxygenase n=1 Tax=Subtercola endophyticus TaxID=2895559 RepID=UPI001E34065C|nr:2-oxoglutarate and iron-dependent oxygenase domain-containing protein [Subtercola endophyticus]UFS59032.1 isopenicillin N synthase family oxygenase [Subtercola endophyticus]
MSASARPAFEIATIDVSAYVADAPTNPADARRAVARAFDAAARTGGIMQIVGHGIPPAVVAGLENAIDDFITLPESDKLALRLAPEINRGYSPPRSEALSKSIGIDPAQRTNDNFESFNIGAAASEFAHLALPPEHYPENVWPGHPVAFRGQVADYYREAQRVAGILMRVIADALGVAPSFFDAFDAAAVDMLRLNVYPEASGGMGAHTDFGFVTVLWADRMPGLQVLGPDNSWHDVVVAQGALLVNLGDLAARLTNDVWPAALHRVRVSATGNVRRRSAAFFHDGYIDATIEPHPAFVEPGERPLYEPITVRENLVAKLRGSRSGQRNYAAARDATRARSARD